MTIGWDFDKLRDILKEPKPKLKYIITDDRDEFIKTLERIVESALEHTGDNLRYLEGKSKIQQVRDGAAIEDVFPWVKECNGL
jgi:hypothetical protein